MIVDIHNHILPGLDDGAKDMEETVQMCLQAAENEITHIVATPHHMNGTYTCRAEDLFERIAGVNSVLMERDIPLEILPGMEVHLYGNLVDDLDSIDKRIVTIGNRKSKYVLVELPYTHVPHYTAEIFYRIQLKDYIPVIAHPERNAEIKRHPNLLVELIQKGALAQVTAASVAGRFGEASQKHSIKFLKHHLVHFVASDAHNTTNRSFQLKGAYEYIGRHISCEYKDMLMQNAIHIVNGTEFITPPPVKFEKRIKLFPVRLRSMKSG